MSELNPAPGRLPTDLDYLSSIDEIIEDARAGRMFILVDDEDREMFQVELGITELGLERLIRSIYDLLGLQTFFTAGEKEIRAWTIRSGDLAPVAAGVIHTDFEKKFIRAEVYTVNELVEYETEAAIKAAGRMRTEGRTYAMGEGDVVHFLVSPRTATDDRHGTYPHPEPEAPAGEPA